MGSWRQCFAAFLCTFSVATTGVTFTWLEPLMGRLVSENSEFHMTTTEISWLVSFIEIGELFFTIPAGLLADRFGRKWTLYTIGPTTVMSWVLIATTRSMYIQYAVRFIHGMNIAIVFAIAPMYIAEIAHPKIRGFLSGNFQTMWGFGLLYTYVIGPYMSYQNFLYICALFPLLFTLLFPLMPETPYYLLMSGCEAKAEKALVWLRGTPAVEDELKKIKISVEKDMSVKASWRDVISTKKDVRIFFSVQLICFIKYMNGTPAINMYAANIYSHASNITVNENVMTIISGSLLVVSAFFGSLMSDTIGRRPLLIASTLANTVLHIFLAVYFYLVHNTHLDMSGFSWAVYAAVGGSCIVTNIGLGSLLQTVQAELFPSHTRALGGGATGVTSGISTFIDLKQYQIVLDYFGLYMNFIIFAVWGLIGAIVMYYVIPETKGKALGEIHGNGKNLEEPIGT